MIRHLQGASMYVQMLFVFDRKHKFQHELITHYLVIYVRRCHHTSQSHREHRVAARQVSHPRSYKNHNYQSGGLSWRSPAPTSLLLSLVAAMLIPNLTSFCVATLAQDLAVTLNWV